MFLQFFFDSLDPFTSFNSLIMYTYASIGIYFYIFPAIMIKSTRFFTSASVGIFS